jgi:hypothetical protein
MSVMPIILNAQTLWLCSCDTDHLACGAGRVQGRSTRQASATTKGWLASTDALSGPSLTAIGDPDKIIALAQREFAIP